MSAFKNESISLVLKASNFSAIKHKFQKRLDSEETPYINHPIGVAFILTSEGQIFDEDVIVAALLHDTVEDTETSFEEIEREFGAKIRKIVSEVTDDKSLPKEERKRLQQVNASNCSKEAKLVKLADKLYNLRDLQKEVPKGWNQERCRKYFIWAKTVIDNLRGTNQRLEDALDEVFKNSGHF